jgi:hypothetical protein
MSNVIKNWITRYVVFGKEVYALYLKCVKIPNDKPKTSFMRHNQTKIDILLPNEQFWSKEERIFVENMLEINVLEPNRKTASDTEEEQTL